MPVQTRPPPHHAAPSRPPAHVLDPAASCCPLPRSCLTSASPWRVTLFACFSGLAFLAVFSCLSLVQTLATSTEPCHLSLPLSIFLPKAPFLYVCPIPCHVFISLPLIQEDPASRCVSHCLTPSLVSIFLPTISAVPVTYPTPPLASCSLPATFSPDWHQLPISGTPCIITSPTAWHLLPFVYFVAPSSPHPLPRVVKQFLSLPSP